MTVRLHLVRHGQAASGYDAATDPGLDDVGTAQAESLVTHFGDDPLRLLTSPMRRARETAAPLERHWGRSAFVEARITEIPSPTTDVTERGFWLADVLASNWRDLDDDLQQWREHLALCLLDSPVDTVAVSHFVAINVITGLATGDDRVVNFRPGNASVTTVEIVDGQFTLVGRGPDTDSVVN